MALVPQPIFFHKIRRNEGARKKLITLLNTEPEDFSGVLEDVVKPEWLEIEGIYSGATIEVGGGRKITLPVSINTTHKFFPEEERYEDSVTLEFRDDREPVEILLTLQEIFDDFEDFHGVFAIDFGTSNTVYAYKQKLASSATQEEVFDRPKFSSEIPSLIFFKDVSDPKNPKFVIGNEAKFDIKEYSHQTYSYFMSFKRLLGIGTTYVVLDEFSGAKKDHKQTWSIDDIASFFLRAAISQAQHDIGARITDVVATFPTMFPEEKLQALRGAFRKAFEALEIDFTEDSLALDLNETNAAAFSYIYGTMLDEFRRFELREKENLLLAFDFGGGTIDISLVNARITADDVGRMNIETDFRGITGEKYYGGDNVTLAVQGILKKRMALKLAENICAKLDKESEAETEKAGESKEQWDAGGIWDTAPKADKEEKEEGGWDSGDIWDGGEEKAAATEEEEQEQLEDLDAPDLQDILNQEPEENYNAAAKMVNDDKDTIEHAISKACDIETALVSKEKKAGTFVDAGQTRMKAGQLEEALETRLPTKWSLYEDENPMKMEIARKLFHELWHEAELLKIRLSTSDTGVNRVQGVMRRCARYASSQPIIFNDITVSLEELSAQIDERITKAVEKAHNLYMSATEVVHGSIVIRKPLEELPPLKILVYGNSSHLPIVKEKLLEVFDIGESDLVVDRELLKASVALGACEEHSLRREFGAEGFIRYHGTDFLNALPYSVGLLHRELTRLGYKNGFAPIFRRGSEKGALTTLDSENCFLIHTEMRELALYADYHDGHQPTYIGWFDWQNPDGKEDLDELLAADKVEEPEEPSEEAESDSEGEFSYGSDSEEPAEDKPVPYMVRFELAPNRNIKAIDLKNGNYYISKPVTEKWADDENPFSGTH
jgi:molecular chaperone DnaK (HSP70)